MSKSKQDWLKRHRGPIESRLEWCAKELRWSKTKSARLVLADVLDELWRELRLQRPIDRRGRPVRPENWRRGAIAEALSIREGISLTQAARAVCGNDNKAVDAVRKLIISRRRRGGIWGFNEKEYETAKRQLQRIHRIK